MNYTDLYQWFKNYKDYAIANDNDNWKVFARLQERIERKRDEYTVLDVCREGKDTATRLNEPYWYLFFAIGEMEAKLASNTDFDERLDIVTRLYVESRKPQYEGCAIRVIPEVSLLSQYLSQDTLGYAEEIITGANHLIANEPLDQEQYQNLIDIKLMSQLVSSDWDNAEETAEIYLDVYSGYQTGLAKARLCLVEIAFRKHQLDTCRQHLKILETTVADSAPTPENRELRGYAFAGLLWQLTLGREYDDLRSQIDHMLAELQSGRIKVHFLLIHAINYHMRYTDSPRNLIYILSQSSKQSDFERYPKAMATLGMIQSYRSGQRFLRSLSRFDLLDEKSLVHKFMMILVFFMIPVFFANELRNRTRQNILINAYWICTTLFLFALFLPMYVIVILLGKVFINEQKILRQRLENIVEQSPRPHLYIEKLHQIQRV